MTVIEKDRGHIVDITRGHVTDFDLYLESHSKSLKMLSEKWESRGMFVQ